MLYIYFSRKSVWVSAHSEKDAARKAASKLQSASPDRLAIERDPDVLDTWFSSSLYPFAALGWPENTDDLKRLLQRYLVG